MSACDDDDGRPQYQVSRFHAIAPTRPARITCGSISSMWMRPLPIVFATAVPKRKRPMKLKAAAQTTATEGESTRVETTVAMEFAESWNPLMKSKMNATSTIAITKLAVTTSAV